MRWAWRALAQLTSRHIALPMRVAQRLARSGDVGRMKLRGAGERLHGCVISHHEIEHRSEKKRFGGGVTQRLRTDSSFGKERTQPRWCAGDEGERLNCNAFSHLPGGLHK